MPAIIGKHVQALNTKVYESVEEAITLQWHTIWNPNVLTRTSDQEEQVLSFLSSFNTIVAKDLMNQIEDYDLLQKVKTDLSSVSPLVIEEESTLNWLKNTMNGFLSQKEQTFDFTDDFLRQHITDIRTGLLIELHIQFMSFFTKIQTDIIELLTIYYDE